MPDSFKQRQVALSFRKFNDYASDVVHSDYSTFPTRFEIFLHHCENDEVMKVITSQLKEVDTNFQEWYLKGQNTGGSMVGSKEFRLPVDEIKRDALLYQLLLKFNSKEIDLLGFCMDYFGETSSINATIRSFNSAILSILVRSIGYKLEEISESIKSDLNNTQDVPIKMLNVYYDYRVTMGDENKIFGDAAIGGGVKIDKKRDS